MKSASIKAFWLSYAVALSALSIMLFVAPAVSRAQSAPAGQILDPTTVAWPRTFTTDGYDMAIFQPQISTWKGNQLAGRFAVGVRPTGSKDEAYGVVSFTARAEIDKLNRLVTLEDLELGKVNFPTQSAKFKADPDPPEDIKPALRLALATKKVDPMLPTGNGTPPLNLYTASAVAAGAGFAVEVDSGDNRLPA
jgi:hypothetical protein